jgi:hypothetical protein
VGTVVCREDPVDQKTRSKGNSICKSLEGMERGDLLCDERYSVCRHILGAGVDGRGTANTGRLYNYISYQHRSTYHDEILLVCGNGTSANVNEVVSAISRVKRVLCSRVYVAWLVFV